MLAFACFVFAPSLARAAGEPAGSAGAVSPVLPAAPQAPQWIDAATVAASSGEARLLRPSALLDPVRVGEIVRPGDRVLTGADGRVELRFLDGAVLAVQPGSDFRIEAYRFDADGERSFLQLVKGAIRTVSGVIGKRNRDDYRMTTPTATIGIRGTEYEASESLCGTNGASACVSGERPGLMVRVIRGRVAVSNAAGSTEVPEGQTLFVRNQAAPASFDSGEPAPARPATPRGPAIPAAPSPIFPSPAVPAPAPERAPTPMQSSRRAPRESPGAPGGAVQHIDIAPVRPGAV